MTTDRRASGGGSGFGKRVYRSEHDGLVFSPTDICRFVESRFASWMERYALEYPEQVRREEASEELELIQRKGRDHERAYERSLADAGHEVFDPTGEADPVAATLDAMRRGRPMIRQAPLRRDEFRGRADLLIRVEGRSDLGDFFYLPRDVKLGMSPKPKYVIQLCAYAEMIEPLQGRLPDSIELVLGDGRLEALRTVDHFHYYLEQKRAFLESMRSFDPRQRPAPRMGDEHGEWAAEAEAWLERIDHLSRVAGIRGSQIKRLEAANITTMTALAETTSERVPRLDRRVFERLRRQARLQVESAGRRRPCWEILDHDPDGPPRGLALLPPESPNDVFFDMEGYPLADGGLEYLFGASYREGDGPPAFVDWWAHDEPEEKAALEGFVDWVHARWTADPTLHVYHYASYEITALRRLMGRHGTRELQIDRLLRNDVFVDLYRVVRHGLLVGEPGYSIKNLERLFRDDRSGQVKSAAGSIVEYQRWIDSGEPRDWRRSPILKGIRDYNRDDCESTLMLAAWLRARQAERGIRYRGKEPPDEPDDPEGEPSEGNRRRAELAAEMLATETDPVGRLLGHLLEYHRREDRPRWWELFGRHAMSDEELYDDLACLGGLRRVGAGAFPVRRSLGLRYEFDPDQDTRIDEGDSFFVAHDLDIRGRVEELDRDAGRVALVFADSVTDKPGWPLPPAISIIPGEFVPIEPLQKAIERAARQWRRGRALPAPADAFLRRQRPALEGHGGGPIIVAPETPSDGCVRVVPAMRETTLSIQGPPGSGKTHTAARMALDLIGRGRRVGVTSNSHKAVLNLMVKCAELADGPLRCLKVGGDEDDPMLARIPGVRYSAGGRAGAEAAGAHDLIGGTAWLFSREDMHGLLDYLFVDEAGQVSVANLVAMSGSTGNIVLIGDQMQLAQPTQAAHPEDSGDSTLEYLLQGSRTIPADRGVFLDLTYRLHPDICRVSSEAFYDGKLRSADGCANRRILLDGGGLVTREAGILFVPVEHEGNTQGSDEEVAVVARIFEQLLGRRHVGRDGKVAGRLGDEDVLVVAPYNMQVRKLVRALPERARVGSVDKFQGQEAPVVIVSMCASEGHDSPRGIEFLLNPNRMNVALSRAQALAIVVGHPGLARTRCRTLTQQKLVNLFCRIVDEGGGGGEIAEYDVE